MDPNAMEPHGLALLEYLGGHTSSKLLIRRDDGQEDAMPVEHFFRKPAEFTPLERTALDRCEGHVLDVGAGSGLHSLFLQTRGIVVTALDISPHAVRVMHERGVETVHCADVFDYREGPFDTILMLGHGIGMVETLAGLDRLLKAAQDSLAHGGQLLLDSLDVRNTDDPAHLAYQDANRGAGRYIGELRLQFEHRGTKGPFCGWLHVDPDTLREHAAGADWRCEILARRATGDYLARLNLPGAAGIPVAGVRQDGPRA